MRRNPTPAPPAPPSLARSQWVSILNRLEREDVATDTIQALIVVRAQANAEAAALLQAQASQINALHQQQVADEVERGVSTEYANNVRALRAELMKSVERQLVGALAEAQIRLKTGHEHLRGGIGAWTRAVQRGQDVDNEFIVYMDDVHKDTIEELQKISNRWKQGS